MHLHCKEFWISFIHFFKYFIFSELRNQLLGSKSEMFRTLPYYHVFEIQFLKLIRQCAILCIPFQYYTSIEKNLFELRLVPTCCNKYDANNENSANRENLILKNIHVWVKSFTCTSHIFDICCRAFIVIVCTLFQI